MINIGVFTALYFVVFFVVSFVGYIPILLVMLPVICPIIANIPFMLFLSKTKKFGMALPMFFGYRDNYLASMVSGYGQEYVDTIASLPPDCVHSA